jgi:predicted ATPase/DNA-binding XRE family transcriptional regulator
LDLTQQELARRVGCSLATIVKIESDERRPSRQIADLLANHLEISPEQREQFLKVARQEKSAATLGLLTPLSKPEPVPDIRQNAPVPKPHHSHLPVPPTQLVGREHELNLIPKQLLEPSCRMLTLTGPGGIGKTRLAIEVGRALVAHFSDGVFFISLAGVGTPESILPAIADVLGLGFSGPADGMVQLTNFLHDKEILLIFDNMEHLLDGRDQVGQILQSTHHIKILVTSREQLHLQWEWLFEVQGLPLPDENDASVLETNSAIQLFVQRAQQASRTFSLEAEDISSILRICRLVGGLPLAIELAASWSRMLSTQEIAKELEKSLDFLETRKLDVPQRHRSIKTVFDHSWDMLTANERELLMKLSVFQGGFTRETAATVAGASLFLLSSLVDKSLLRHSKDPDRYDLHELVRTYAFAQLQNHPAEETDVSLKYAIHYAEWIRSLEWEFKSPRQTQTSQIIRAETCHWHCTWHWAIAHQRLDLLRKMLFTLTWYFEVNGYYDEATSAIKAAVEHFRKLGAPASLKTADEESTFAALVDSFGWFEFRKGNVEMAVPLLKESLEIALKHNDTEVLYYIYGNWGYLSLFTGEVEEARRLTIESLLYAELLKTWHQAIAISVLGIVAYQQGDLQEAHQRLTESLRRWRPVGEPRGLVFTMIYLGMTTIAMKEYGSAKSILTESNQIAEANMDRWAHAFGLDLLGVASMSQGQNEEALLSFKQSIALYNEIGDQMNSAQSTIHLGQACTAMCSEEEAKRLYLEVYSNAQTNKWTQVLLNVLISFADMPNMLTPKTKLAVALSALEHPAITPYLRERSMMMRDQAKACLSEGEIKAAEELSRGKSPELWAQELLK